MEPALQIRQEIPSLNRSWMSLTLEMGNYSVTQRVTLQKLYLRLNVLIRRRAAGGGRTGAHIQEVAIDALDLNRRASPIHRKRRQAQEKAGSNPDHGAKDNHSSRSLQCTRIIRHKAGRFGFARAR